MPVLALLEKIRIKEADKRLRVEGLFVYSHPIPAASRGQEDYSAFAIQSGSNVFWNYFEWILIFTMSVSSICLILNCTDQNVMKSEHNSNWLQSPSAWKWTCKEQNSLFCLCWYLHGNVSSQQFLYKCGFSGKNSTFGNSAHRFC